MEEDMNQYNQNLTNDKITMRNKFIFDSNEFNDNINNVQKNPDIKDNCNYLSEEEISKLNDDYTKQINDIISKNFKSDILSNNYQNMPSNKFKGKNNYLELERERKLLLLKNIELEKEINNLNIFVDSGRKNSNNMRVKTPNSNNVIRYKDKIIKTNKISKINKMKIDYKIEIKEAQKKVKNLDDHLNKLKQEIKFNNLNIDMKSMDKIKEIKIWRETFYEEFEKYKNLLKELKNSLNKDKKLYINIISKMKQQSNENINIIFENYKNQILENEQKIDFLKKENEKIVNKENKVKEIYLYNFK